MNDVIEKVRIAMLKDISENDATKKFISDFQFKKCKDQFAASIIVKDGKLPLVEFDKKVKVKNSENKKNGVSCYFDRISVENCAPDNTENIIIVVLESPHKDEYYEVNKKKVDNGPAYGKTGDNFNKYFPLLLRNAIIDKKILLKSGHYKILFMNAIQYQCSLGDITPKYRDEFFLKCWEKDKCKEDFKERLKQYISLGKECIVINCCTKGKKNLQKLVHKEIQDVCSDIPAFLCTHPCSWFVPDIQ